MIMANGKLNFTFQDLLKKYLNVLLNLMIKVVDALTFPPGIH